MTTTTTIAVADLTVGQEIRTYARKGAHRDIVGQVIGSRAQLNGRIQLTVQPMIGEVIFVSLYPSTTVELVNV